MPLLADLQARIAHAVIGGDFERIGPVFVGGVDPRNRLAIHQRHYETSLGAALLQKFPATAWLAGAQFVAAAARAYVRAHPPRRPCIAEYGGDFPAFLGGCERAREVPYLESFAALEWAVGQASIAVDARPLAWAEIVRVGSESLLDSRLTLQPGLRYLRSAWGVDELIAMYLRGSEAETFELSEAEAHIEVRGARGSLQIDRIASATFAFRSSLCAGLPIGEASETALECDDAFDPGAALRDVVQSGLATAISATPAGEV